MFEEKLQEHYDDLLAYCRSRTEQRADAQDLAQDTIERALQKRETYDEFGRMMGWLKTIAHRIQYSKDRDQERENSIIYGQSRSARDGMHGEDKEREHGDVECIEACEVLINRVRDQIKPKYAEVMLLRARGLEYKQIADQLDMPIGTVMSRLYRGRKKAREIISNPLD